MSDYEDSCYSASELIYSDDERETYSEARGRAYTDPRNEVYVRRNDRPHRYEEPARLRRPQPRMSPECRPHYPHARGSQSLGSFEPPFSEERDHEEFTNSCYESPYAPRFVSPRGRRGRGRPNPRMFRHGNFEEAQEDYAPYLTPEKLAGILAGYPNFSSSLLNILENHGVRSNLVRRVVVSSSDAFHMTDTMVRLSLRIKLCLDHTGNRGCRSKDICDSLHICPGYVHGTCRGNPCMLGHRWRTNHNVPLFQRFHVNKLPDDTIHKLVEIATRNRRPNYPLDICLNYNNNRCKLKYCRRLHVCYTFVTNGARCKSNTCKLNHSVNTENCKRLLRAHGISTDETPRDIVDAIVSANPKINKVTFNGRNGRNPQSNTSSSQRDKSRSGSDESSSSDSDQNQQTPIRFSSQSSSRSGNNANNFPSRKPVNIATNSGSESDETSSSSDSDQSDSTYTSGAFRSKSEWSHDLTGSVNISKICYNSVEGRCQNERKGCSKLHATKHFHWQIRGPNNTWFNLREEQVQCLEEAYCDPANDGVDLPRLNPSTLTPSTRGLIKVMGNDVWQAAFQTMELSTPSGNKGMQMRRLCTESIPEIKLKENTYLWYFADINNTWIQYGNVDSTQNDTMKSSVSSSDIEKQYCRNPNSSIIFKTGKFQYTLDFRNMLQINQNTSVSRRVRRRPQSSLKQTRNNPPTQRLDMSTSKSHWSDHEKCDINIPEICYASVENVCANESNGCQRLHAKFHYHWQVQGQDNSWYNFQPAQVNGLENAYCDPCKESVTLLPMHESILGRPTNGLSAILGQNNWQADLLGMKLSNSSNNMTLTLRRLCTQNPSPKPLKENTYVWYFKDIRNKWIEYGQYDSTRNADMRSNIFSTEIEVGYNQNKATPINFHTGKFNYTLDFSTMTQTNQNTRQSRSIRRRPQPHLKEITAEDMPSTWDPMSASEDVKNVYLSPTSAEFQVIADLFKGELPQTQVLRIRRVQNPKLWTAFQNNISAMANSNVCQMFFGTSHSMVPGICYDNLQQPANTSTGTTFSNTAAEAYKQCQAHSNGQKYMFIMRVVKTSGSNLTGLFSRVGISPPVVNMKTNQDYYPEYVVTLQ